MTRLMTLGLTLLSTLLCVATALVVHTSVSLSSSEVEGRLQVLDDALTTTTEAAMIRNDPESWTRYEKLGDELHSTIGILGDLLGEDFHQDVEQLNNANQELMQSEYASFTAQEQSGSTTAIGRLASAEYSNEKKKYALAVRGLVAHIESHSRKKMFWSYTLALSAIILCAVSLTTAVRHDRLFPG